MGKKTTVKGTSDQCRVRDRKKPHSCSCRKSQQESDLGLKIMVMNKGPPLFTSLFSQLKDSTMEVAEGQAPTEKPNQGKKNIER